MTSTLAWIRRNYNVPAFRGTPVTWDGRPAVIIGGRRQYLLLRVQGEKRPIVDHPTSDVRYPVLPLPTRPRGWCEHCWEEHALTRKGVVVRHQRNGADHFPPAERLCPGAGSKPWAVCSWTIPTPAATGPVTEGASAA